MSNLYNNVSLEEYTRSHPLEELRDATIAVHATDYLQKLLETPPTQEPLLCAIGGFPLHLRTQIEADLDNWSQHGITPRFVFDGVPTVGTEELGLRRTSASMRKQESAWITYSNGLAADAVVAFGKTGLAKARHLFRYFQEVLHDRGLAFEVAPNSACAQMAYMDQQDLDDVHGIMGPSALLLYGIDNSVITSINWETGTVRGLIKSDILQRLGVTEDTLIDAFLMVGSQSLPPFPALLDIVPDQPPKLQDAINMLRTAGKSVANMCETFNDTLQKSEPNWQDLYQKARMGTKHAVVLTKEGNVTPLKHEELTSDHFEYIGLQLPPEIYHYMNMGLIGSKVASWFTWLQGFAYPPLAGGEGEAYRNLISKTLIPVKEQTAALYAKRMHRAYQHKTIDLKFYYDPKKVVTMNHNDVTPAPERQVNTWRVKKDVLDRAKIGEHKPGSIAYALLSLEDDEFVKATILAEPTKVVALKTEEEVLANTLWRYFHLRGYIDDSHKLTQWGQALATALKTLPNAEQQEAAAMAFELVRFKQLNAQNEHEDWIGAPAMGTEEQRKYCLLISRVASLLKLRHKSIGYSGPLSKDLLAYHSVINVVRSTERDLVEAAAATMFMSSHAERKDRKDWAHLGLSLPFYKDVDVGLGILVKTYLDDQYAGFDNEKEKQEAKGHYVGEWPMANAVDTLGDMELAYCFFDAVHVGLKSLGDKFEDQKLWKEAAEYLEDRR